MIELSIEAEKKLDDYLRRVHVSAAGVESDIRDHVFAALADSQQPVTLEEMSAVLDRLGDPHAWIPDDERPVWRRVFLRFAHGPESWRLAYLSFALFVGGMALLPVGGVILTIASFFLSRAFIDITTPESRLGKRWLVYPSIIFWTAMIGMIAIFGPIVGMWAWGLGEGGIQKIASMVPAEGIRRTAGYLTATAGLWWLVLSVIVAIVARPIATFFAPVTERLRRRHAFALSGFAALLIGAGAVALLA